MLLKDRQIETAVCIVIQMNTDIDKLLREYNIPEGVLTAEELRLLRDGGIRDSDSDNAEEEHEFHGRTRPHVNAVELETLKSVHRNQLSMKEKQIQFLQSELSRRDQLMEIERAKFRAEQDFEQERLLGELRNAKAKAAQAEDQIPLIHKTLGAVRDMLAGQIPETTYLRLRDIPDRELPLSEWLLVNVWELVYPHKKEADFLKREINKLREELTIASDKQGSLYAELEHCSRLLSSKDDDERRHMLNFENNRKGMELELEKCREEVEVLREKGARYDELLRDYNFTKQERELMEEKLQYYDKDPQKVVAGLAGTRVAEDNQARRLELLAQDKEYLTKENISLLEKNKRLEDRLDRLEAQLLSEKNRSQEYLHQLLNVKTDSMSSYEQRIYKEISELKEKHHMELQVSKNSLVDIYEKQIRFLREGADEKDIRLKEVELQLREKVRESDGLLVDNRSFQRRMETDLAETRVSLRIKNEELDRMSSIYEETLGNLKANKSENEMLREKVNLLKAEYYKTEASSRDDLTGLKAQIAVLREQLAGYEMIEKEIDEAVIGLSSLKPNDNNIFLNTINSVPSSNRRRVQQALGLAQRLQAKQREIQEAMERMRQLVDENANLKEELRVSKELLTNSNQPYSYLVSTIEEKEKEILALRNSSRKRDQDSDNLKAELNQATRQLQEAENDIKRLLMKRESIQNIQSLLINLASGTTSKSDIASVVEEIQEILGGGQNSTTKTYGADSSTRAKSREQQLPAWYQKLSEKKSKR